MRKEPGCCISTEGKALSSLRAEKHPSATRRPHQRTVALKLTEKMRMNVDTTLSVSWLQKLNQPSRRSASLADFRFRRAGSASAAVGGPGAGVVTDASALFAAALATAGCAKRHG